MSNPKIPQMTNQQTLQYLSRLVQTHNAKELAKALFNFDVTKRQEEMIKDILWGAPNLRLSISAMTRYGKSQIVAIAIGIFLFIELNKKVFFIAPTTEQAMILRTYLNELVLSCPLLLNLSDIEQESKTSRLKKEVSKSRVTFKNGNEYRVFTAHQDGNGLMGHGLGKKGGILIVDEACKITRTANTKILRMLGDNPEDSKIVELYNPWDRDNKAYEHSISLRWKVYQIGWEEAVEEGRITQEFIDSQREELTPLEFEVLYDSQFPETSEDSIFNFNKVKASFEKEVKKQNIQKIISCDVADKGLDRTVIMRGYKNLDTGEFFIEEIYSEPKSENMQVAGKINQWYFEYGADIINIDTIGVGVGVVSRVREVLYEADVIVNACHFGEGVGTAGKPIKAYAAEKLLEKLPESRKKRFINRKAEQYFRLSDLFNDELMSIPDQQQLQTELMIMKWELTSNGKIKIIDPDKSPDFADALVYFIWDIGEEVILDFG